MKNNKTLALISCDAPQEIKSTLGAVGFQVISLTRDCRLQSPVASHADMLICVIGKNLFCSDRYYFDNRKMFQVIESYGYKVIPCDVNISSEYPGDIAFNMLFISGSIMGRVDNIPQEIRELSIKNKIPLIGVKQGYTKCSTLLLDNSALISADGGIIKEAKKLGISTLKIDNSPDAVTLPGYDYGFIGGASGVFNKTVYLTGDITQHPNGSQIRSFCQTNGFEIYTLRNENEKCIDIGGIIFLPMIS